MGNKGIVFTAGGPRYFLNAYINCRLLRVMGCQLPIEWCYMGEEMPIEWLEIVKEIAGVSLINMGGDATDKAKSKGGWQSKIKAVIASSFDHVLFLDADSFPLRDPTYLFEHGFYTSTECVLWPDPFFWTLTRRTELKGMFGVDLPERQVESGQMMFHKSGCMAGLEKVLALNVNSEFVYGQVFGDKDTFLIGMLQAQANFKVVPHILGHINCGMVQKDFDGKDIFLHLAGGKFAWHGRPFVKKMNFPNVDLAVEITQELKKRLQM